MIFGTFEHFVCLIVMINFNCNNKTLFVECIVRCKQLSIKLLDEESPVSCLSPSTKHGEEQGEAEWTDFEISTNLFWRNSPFIKKIEHLIWWKKTAPCDVIQLLKIHDPAGFSVRPGSFHWGKCGSQERGCPVGQKSRLGLQTGSGAWRPWRSASGRWLAERSWPRRVWRLSTEEVSQWLCNNLIKSLK